MKAPLTITVLIFLVMVRFTEGLTWNTKIRATVCCQGNKQLLIWNFTKGENERVTELHWFFNETTLVCLDSSSTGFLVGDLYEGRVERNGTAGILLKNVSLHDTGEYTLYVKLEEEKERNVQGIDLTVVEPPPSQCKPIIKKTNSKGIISCFTSCERSPLSLEWIINGTKDPEEIGPYLVVNSLGTSEKQICCLRDFKCFDDYQTKFCTQNNISFTEDMHTVADINHMDPIPILISLIVTLFIIVVITCVILNRRRCRLYKTSLMLPKDQQPYVDVNDVQVPDAVKPKHSNTVVQCNEDIHPQSLTLAANIEKISDNILKKIQELEANSQHIREQNRPLQDSNQHIQIVNNISIDKDFLQSIIHSNTDLMAEIQPISIRKGTKKPKSQLHQKTNLRNKENKHKYSFEMTPVKCSDFKNYDTDTFETSESEDASSELPSTP